MTQGRVLQDLVSAGVVPTSVAGFWSDIRKRVPDHRDELDRRGFLLTQWQSPVTTRKPVELSLEHEVRLAARTTTEVADLLLSLIRNHQRTLGRVVGDIPPDLAALTLQQEDRPPGPQSVDVYWDRAEPAASLIEQQLTVRQRIATSKFMTWSSEEPDLRAYNLELPASPLPGSEGSGLVVRLEFNWLERDEDFQALARGGRAPSWHPLALAAEVLGESLVPLRSVVTHTTHRQKFILAEHGEPRIHLNVDLIEAVGLHPSESQVLYEDVDVAPAQPVGKGQVEELVRLGQALQRHYGLAVNEGTKAARDRALLLTGQ